jgi:hypothetical protein
MKRTALFFAAAALVLSACAPGPNAVAPAAMPAGLYDNLTCAQARAERVASAKREAALTDRQRSAATGDAVGVLLIGLPVSSMTGDDVQDQLATERGRLIALDARLMRC